MKIVWQRHADVSDYFVVGPDTMVSEVPDMATTEDIEWYIDALNHISDLEGGTKFQNADGYRPVGRLDDIVELWEDTGDGREADDPDLEAKIEWFDSLPNDDPYDLDPRVQKVVDAGWDLCPVIDCYQGRGHDGPHGDDALEAAYADRDAEKVERLVRERAALEHLRRLLPNLNKFVKATGSDTLTVRIGEAFTDGKTIWFTSEAGEVLESVNLPQGSNE